MTLIKSLAFCFLALGVFAMHPTKFQKNECNLQLKDMKHKMIKLQDFCTKEVQEQMGGEMMMMRMLDTPNATNDKMLGLNYTTKATGNCSQQLNESIVYIKMIVDSMEENDQVNALNEILEFVPVVEGIEQLCFKSDKMRPIMVEYQQCINHALMAAADFEHAYQNIKANPDNQTTGVSILQTVVGEIKMAYLECQGKELKSHTKKTVKHSATTDACMVSIEAALPEFEKLMKLMKPDTDMKVEKTKVEKELENTKVQQTKFQKNCMKKEMKFDPKSEKVQKCMTELTTLRTKINAFVDKCY